MEVMNEKNSVVMAAWGCHAKTEQPGKHTFVTQFKTVKCCYL